MRFIRHKVCLAVFSGLAVLAVPAAAGTASAAAAPAASAVTLAGDWAPFSRCPVQDPAMLAATGTTSIAYCNTADSPSGSIKLGSITAATGDSNLQFGLVQSSGQYSIVSPSGGAIVAAPAQIPGGLLGLMCPSGIPAVSALCAEITNSSLNTVTAVVQPAGNPSGFNLGAGLSTGQPILTLPVKIQLQNPLLGSGCYIGSDSAPIVLHPENLTAPAEAIEQFDASGTTDPNGAFATIVLTGTQGDSTFAAPGASGCGPLGVADAAIDLKSGLPSPSGNNSLVLNNAVTHALGGFEFPRQQYPHEGQNLAAAWQAAVQP
jgi:hypothetical protein